MILTPTNSPSDWRALLADPHRHWRKGYSAMPLAYCWEYDGTELFIGWVSYDGEYGEKSSCEGTVVTRECPHCGHHEIGVETNAGNFVPVRPGLKVQIKN